MATKKQITAKKPAKKPAAKKSQTKKAVSKKPAKPVAKKTLAKATQKKKPAIAKTAKPAAKKSAVKKPTQKTSASRTAMKAATPPPVAAAKPETEKKEIKRVPPRIIRKLSPMANPPEEDYIPIDTEKAVAFAMSIAQEMKRSAAEREAQREQEAKDGIRLSRRPTTRTQGKNTAKFPAADLKIFKKRLLEARQRATSGVDAMKATGFNESEDREADGGDGTAQTLRLQALGQMGNINRTIQKIDEALHRIDDGTYGVCTMCGNLIRKPRLLNQPFVLTCMECQSEMERTAK